MTDKQRVLFVCVHNSARSQMAEAFLRAKAGDRFDAASAGLEPGRLNPRVVTVMKEIGLDLSDHTVKNVFDLFDQGQTFDTVVTVCDGAQGEKCPYVPGLTNRLHWGFPDPSSFTGSEEEILDQLRGVRDQIRDKIDEWLNELK
jgi:arsenate reductase